jgi:hypothetical protein
MDALELRPFDDEVDAVCRRLDFNNDGLVTLQDFVVNIEPARAAQLANQQLPTRPFTSPINNESYRFDSAREAEDLKRLSAANKVDRSFHSKYSSPERSPYVSKRSVIEKRALRN